jgi:hypothetical protein
MAPAAIREGSRYRWYLAHLFAVAPVAMLVLFGFMAAAQVRTGHVIVPTPGFIWTMQIALPATIVFWIWMLRDHFRKPASRRSGGWSIALIAMNWGAALVYFLVVWRRQHTSGTA